MHCSCAYSVYSLSLNSISYRMVLFVQPIMLGDAALATEFAKRLLLEGVYAIGFSYPVVPKDSARVRMQVSGSLTHEHITTALEVMRKVGEEMGVTKSGFFSSGPGIAAQKGNVLEWSK